MRDEKRYLPVSETEGIFFYVTLSYHPRMPARFFHEIKCLAGMAVIMNGYKGKVEFIVEICDKMDYYIKIPSPDGDFS